MATTIKIGEEVTIGTTAVEYYIDENFAVIEKPGMWVPIHTSADNSGTIQFAIGEEPAAGQEAVPADKQRLYPGVRNGHRNLWAKASGAGQKFTIG